MSKFIPVLESAIIWCIEKGYHKSSVEEVTLRTDKMKEILLKASNRLIKLNPDNSTILTSQDINQEFHILGVNMIDDCNNPKTKKYKFDS